MHIAEGMLPTGMAIGWYGVSAIFVAKGLKDLAKKNKEAPGFKPLLGLMTAAVFVISILHFPIPGTGSSAHAVGTPIASIMIGPFFGVLASVVTLFFQSIIFAHGGLSTLGANVFTMGIVGSLVAYVLFKTVYRVNKNILIAGFVAGLISPLFVYLSTAIQLALASGDAFSQTLRGLLITFSITQVPMAIVEALFTGFVLSYILKNRPDILRAFKVIK